MIDDLLDLTRIVQGKLTLILRLVIIHLILQDAFANIQSELNQKQIQIVLNFTKEPHHICGDAVRLQQVFGTF